MGAKILSLLMFVSAVGLKADIGLLLQESTGQGMSRFTSAGHSAVYFSNICAATPTSLRRCAPGEDGAVIGNYTTFGEDAPYEWNIVPLTTYLYGVEDRKNIPLYGNAELLRLLQDAYREKYLSSLCPYPSCGSPTAEAHWRDMVGSTFMRDIYCFRVKTTREQDEKMILRFNAMPNVNRYNGFTNNCADFARGVINTWFPGAARRDHFNDFGMTSPKAVAKSFAHFAAKHTELEFSVQKFSQLPGPIQRSMDARKGTEASFRMKKWIIPMLLRPHELGAFIAIYTISGRFNPEKVYKDHASYLSDARTHGEEQRLEREAILGNRKVWASYRTRFQPILDQALHDGLFRDRGDVNSYFKQLARDGHAELDASGAPRIRAGEAMAGLTRDTVLAASSDQRLALKLMLATVDATLRYHAKNRLALPEFQSDWDILTRLNEAATPALPRGQ